MFNTRDLEKVRSTFENPVINSSRWPWTKYLNTLSLRVLSYKMGINLAVCLREFGEKMCAEAFLVQHWHIVNTEHVVFTSNISMTVTNARKKYQLLPWLTKTRHLPPEFPFQIHHCTSQGSAHNRFRVDWWMDLHSSSCSFLLRINLRMMML